jgi:hypothetical protein
LVNCSAMLVGALVEKLINPVRSTDESEALCVCARQCFCIGIGAGRLVSAADPRKDVRLVLDVLS